LCTACFHVQEVGKLFRVTMVFRGCIHNLRSELAFEYLAHISITTLHQEHVPTLASFSSEIAKTCSLHAYIVHVTAEFSLFFKLCETWRRSGRGETQVAGLPVPAPVAPLEAAIACTAAQLATQDASSRPTAPPALTSSSRAPKRGCT